MCMPTIVVGGDQPQLVLSCEQCSSVRFVDFLSLLLGASALSGPL